MDLYDIEWLIWRNLYRGMYSAWKPPINKSIINTQHDWSCTTLPVPNSWAWFLYTLPLRDHLRTQKSQILVLPSCPYVERQWETWSKTIAIGIRTRKSIFISFPVLSPLVCKLKSLYYRPNTDHFSQKYIPNTDQLLQAFPEILTNSQIQTRQFLDNINESNNLF